MNELGIRPGDGARPDQARASSAAGDVPSRQQLRFSGLVIARGQNEVELEIDGQRWVGRSARPLPEGARPGTRVVLEGPAHDPTRGRRPAHLVAVGGQRLQAAAALTLRASDAAPDPAPASQTERARTLEVTLRPPDGRGASLPARLSVIHPAIAAPRAAPPAPSSGEPLEMRLLTRDAGAAPRQPGASPRGPEPLVFEAEARGPDAADRLVLRTGDRLLQVQERLHLPSGARVRLSVEPADAARFERDVRQLARASPAPPGAPARPLAPDAGLAARLLEIVARLADGAPGDVADDARAPPDSAAPRLVHAKGQAAAFRMIELPLGVPPDLVGVRVHLQDDLPEHGGRSRSAAGHAPARAIIALDLERLGGCQLDVLCQDRRIDLWLRSRTVLPERVRLEALALFIAGRDALGFEGDMTFAPGQLLTFEPADPDRPPSTL